MFRQGRDSIILSWYLISTVYYLGFSIPWCATRTGSIAANRKSSLPIPLLRRKLPKRRVRLITEAWAPWPRRESPGLFLCWPHLRPILRKFTFNVCYVAAYLPCTRGLCFRPSVPRGPRPAIKGARSRKRPASSPAAVFTRIMSEDLRTGPLLFPERTPEHHHDGRKRLRLPHLSSRGKPPR
jgi:hypothetical protein